MELIGGRAEQKRFPPRKTGNMAERRLSLFQCLSVAVWHVCFDSLLICLLFFFFLLQLFPLAGWIAPLTSSWQVTMVASSTLMPLPLPSYHSWCSSGPRPCSTSLHHLPSRPCLKSLEFVDFFLKKNNLQVLLKRSIKSFKLKPNSNPGVSIRDMRRLFFLKWLFFKKKISFG